ncbi:roadblock/LC7 domain-containing protein [Streptomyces sp. NPDC001941]|uniref:roadblock/LC7 domain-containing protein n=1 Tax=Streptomyces sp. NPDC001941 TaxID=3154659 RepID=UPI00331FBC51
MTLPTDPLSTISDRLERFVAQTPGIVRAVLFTPDGLQWPPPQVCDADAERFAAACSMLASVAQNLFQDRSGGVRQNAVEHDDGYLFIMHTPHQVGVGTRAVALAFGVEASREADPGTLGAVMSKWIAGIAGHLTVQARDHTAPVR